MSQTEFSPRTRAAAIQSLKATHFDLLVVGGGITGVAVARDAVMRGLKVGLIEKNDFAFGTSSRSSKLIHGGLRYLEHAEIKLVFEALYERALLLKTMPTLVKPLKFFLPIYKKRTKPLWMISIGLWAYDLLSFFDSLGFHKKYSKENYLKEVPFSSREDLAGGFHYYDAQMWDDVMVIDVARDATKRGAHLASYVEAVEPIEKAGRVEGFVCKDRETGESFSVRAKKVVSCTGPWTDSFLNKIDSTFEKWLEPSRGVHILFDLEKLKVPGAVVMQNKDDGRVSFVIPRPDFGKGMAVVGTTDGPAPGDAADISIEKSDVDYLLDLLRDYFPALKLSYNDVVSAYVGVRPLVKPGLGSDQGSSGNLQAVSREHHIGDGPKGVVVVAGGKYTTHRTMAQEIVDYALKSWREEARELKCAAPSFMIKGADTTEITNGASQPKQIVDAGIRARNSGLKISQQLWSRFGADALMISAIAKQNGEVVSETASGFDCLESQLRYCIRYEGVRHLDDFYIRRTALFLAEHDHGMRYAKRLSEVLVEELSLLSEPGLNAATEYARLEQEVLKRTSWKQKVGRS